MMPWFVFVNRARQCVWMGALLLLVACHNAEPPATKSAPGQQAAAPSAVTQTPQAAAPHEALPRAVAGVALGMTVSQAQEKIGEMKCHTNEGRFQVCDAVADQIGDVHKLEIYLHHDHVISVSYESAAPSTPWEALNGLIERYGRPSLSGRRERDKTGRLHEIYGWKDDASLYSVRFMWKDAEAEKPELVGTAVALWDRKGYQQWEAESKPPALPKPKSDEPGQPT